MAPEDRRSRGNRGYDLRVGYEWFPSFDAVPGVCWEPLVSVDASKLSGLDATPRVEEMTLLDDDPYLRVEWLLPSGAKLSNESGSPSAVHQRKLAAGRELAPETVAKGISESLALPGTRGDYHFSLLSAWGGLDTGRRHDLRAFGWIEALCLADISLMEQGPRLVFSEDHWSDQEDIGYPIVPAFARLSSLYQHEGYVAAAVEIETRCVALGGSRPVGEEAISRQTALLEEDGR